MTTPWASPPRLGSSASVFNSSGSSTSSSSHLKPEERAIRIGKRIRETLKVKDDVPKVSLLKNLNLKVLERMFEKGNPGSDINGNITLSNRDGMDAAYRLAMGQMDELFRTSLMRDVVRGMLSSPTLPTPQEWEMLVRAVDIASNARIPTWAAGHPGMQHPTNDFIGIFAEPKNSFSSSNHHWSDEERCSYILDRMENAVDLKKTGVSILFEGVKAAIEYTLNLFTAPASARNVLGKLIFSNLSASDSQVRSQIAWREHPKKLYVELGGQLRDAQLETPQESRERPWALGRDFQGQPLKAKPSPPRTPEASTDIPEYLDLSQSGLPRPV